MNLIRRDCGIKMRLVPYGAGWTDLYADFGEGELYFIISNVMGPGFGSLMEALYYLHPSNPRSEGIPKKPIPRPAIIKTSPNSFFIFRPPLR